MTSQGQSVRVLLIEDSEIDALLLERELSKVGLDPIVSRVETKDDLKRVIVKSEFDVVISDYVLPQFNGLEALSIVREKSDELPFILVSGKIGEEQAAEAIRNGANDYLMKSNLNRLGVAVQRAMEEAVIKLERRKAREDLERSLTELRIRTEQLDDTNRKMKFEIAERKKAQNDVSESREYLKSVIDSAPELIFSVDKNHRVSTWNKSMESLTGIDEKDVIHRSIEKLTTFSNSNDLINLLKPGSIISSKRFEFTLITEDNEKKVIQSVGSIIRGSSNEDLGFLFIGRDITPNVEEHGRLIEGMGYLIKDRHVNSSLDLFLSLTRAGKKGLFITRANPGMLSSWLPSSSNIETVTLYQNNGNGSSISMAADIVDIVGRFAESEPSVILVDAGHYLVACWGFSKFLDMLFQLSEILSKKKSILLVRIDPNILDGKDVAFLENELLMLPSHRIEDVVIEDDTYAMLRFIQDQSDNNTIVSLKKISSKFQISHVTVAKRIESLENDGLIFVKKIGKQRVPFMTEKGKALLVKRMAHQ